MSVRGMVRLGSAISVTAGFRLSGPIQFGATTYIKEAASGGPLEFYVNNVRAISMESDGGILHGSWNADAAVVTSDRRLKKDIVPLQRTLRDAIKAQGPIDEKALDAGNATNATDVGAGTGTGTGSGSSDGALWLLRQLRPVSYSFKKGAESKYMRFGFIADELESVVPQVVRKVGNREVTEQKAVVYQDLIALLAAAAQEQQRRMDVMGQRFDELLEEVTVLKQDEDAAIVASRKKRRKSRRKGA